MRLIDADDLDEKGIEFSDTNVYVPIEEIWNAPTIEAEPVVHGEWIKLDECDYQCSECGFRFTSADPISKFEYCRCGARMKGANDE